MVMQPATLLPDKRSRRRDLLQRLYPDLYSEDQDLILFERVQKMAADAPDLFIEDLSKRNATPDDLKSLIVEMGASPQDSDEITDWYKQTRYVAPPSVRSIDEQEAKEAQWGIPMPSTRNLTVTEIDEQEKKQEELDRRQNEIFDAVFPGLDQNTVIRTATEDFDGFIDSLISKGRNKDTEDLFKLLGYTDEDLDKVYGQVPYTRSPYEDFNQPQPVDLLQGAAGQEGLPPPIQTGEPPFPGREAELWTQLQKVQKEQGMPNVGADFFNLLTTPFRGSDFFKDLITGKPALTPEQAKIEVQKAESFRKAEPGAIDIKVFNPFADVPPMKAGTLLTEANLQPAIEALKKQLTPVTEFTVGPYGLAEMLLDPTNWALAGVGKVPLTVISDSLKALIKSGASKTFDAALNAGLDKWIARQGRLVTETTNAQSMLGKFLVGDRSWLISRATANFQARMAERKGAEYAAKVAAEDTIADIEKFLIPRYAEAWPAGQVAPRGATQPIAAVQQGVEMRLGKPTPEVQSWINSGNSRPVAESLAQLDALGVIAKVEGHSGAGGLFPFSVRLTDGTYITRPTALHAKVIELTQKPISPGTPTTPVPVSTLVTPEGKAIQIGDTISDGLISGKVVGEGTIGKNIPAYKVELPGGKTDLIIKDQVTKVIPSGTRVIRQIGYSDRLRTTASLKQPKSGDLVKWERYNFATNKWEPFQEAKIGTSEYAAMTQEWEKTELATPSSPAPVTTKEPRQMTTRTWAEQFQETRKLVKAENDLDRLLNDPWTGRENKFAIWTLRGDKNWDASPEAIARIRPLAEEVDRLTNLRDEVYAPLKAATEPWQLTKAMSEASVSYGANLALTQRGDVRTFYRKGALPESGRSFNHMTNAYEDGVSVYTTPRSGSIAGDVDRPWYYGKGKVIGFGGDDEPLIEPIGKWRKYPGHKEIVRQALAEGKPVPSEVLKDYPDLAKQSVTPAPVSPEIPVSTQKPVEQAPVPPAEGVTPKSGLSDVARFWNGSQLTNQEKRQIAKDAGLAAPGRIANNKAWFTLSEQERSALESKVRERMPPPAEPVPTPSPVAKASEAPGAVPPTPPKPPQTATIIPPPAGKPSETERIINQAKEQVRQARPGTITRALQHIPGLKQALHFERPGLKMTGENEKVLVAMVGRTQAISDVATRELPSRLPLLKQATEIFGNDALRGGKVEVKFLGTVEQVKNPITNTLKDIAENPELYDLSVSQKKWLSDLQSRNDESLAWVVDGYGAEIGRFTPKPGGAFLPNVDISEDVVDWLGSETRAIATGRGKTRIWQTARDRMEHDSTFKPEIDVRKLIEGIDSFKASAAGGITFREALGGLTRLEMMEKTHPELFAKMTGLRKQLQSLKGSLGRLDAKLETVVDDFLKSSVEGQDLSDLHESLDVKLATGPRAGMGTEDIQAKIDVVRNQIKDLRPAWEAANPKPYVFIQESLYRYFPSDQAKLIIESLQVTKNPVLKFIERWRGGAFSGDFSPFAIQGSIGVLADPIGSVKTGYGAAKNAIEQHDILRSFKTEALADDIAGDPQAWAQFASLRGFALTGTPSEYAAGFLSKIPGFDKFTEATYLTVTRQGFALWKRTFADFMKAGTPELEAKIAAIETVNRVYPFASASILGQSQARAMLFRALPTSYSFIRKPAEMMGQATMGLGKIATGQWKSITPQEHVALKVIITMAASVLALSAASAAITAKAQGKKDDEVFQAVKDAINPDPYNGKFASIIIGDRRIPLGGPYRAVFRALYPQDVKGIPFPVPFAGLANYLKNRITPALGAQLDLILNKDYSGTQIVKGQFPENLIRGLLYELESALPLSLGSLAQDIRQGKDFKQIQNDVISQFMGVNMVILDNTYFDRQIRKLGQIDPDQEQNPLSIVRPIYGAKDLWSDTTRVLSDVTPEELQKRRMPPLIKTIMELKGVKDKIDLIRNHALTDINTDPKKGDTFLQYYDQWQERQKIDPKDDKKLADFDKKYPRANLGDMTFREYNLLKQYVSMEESDPKGAALFLKDHPELKNNPRNEWLKAHPKENAQLAVFNKANILSAEAYDKVHVLAKEWDIPDSALPEFKDIPTDPDTRKIYFEYDDIVAKFTGNSPEAHLMLKQNDDLRKFLNRSEITTPVPALEIDVKNRVLNDLHDALTSKKDQLSWEALDEHADWNDDQVRKAVYNAQFRFDNTVADEKMVETYIKYDQKPPGDERTLARVDDPALDAWLQKVNPSGSPLQPLPANLNVDVLRLNVKNKALDETFKALPDKTQEAIYLLNPANEVYARDHFRVDALQANIPKDKIEVFIDRKLKDTYFGILNATDQAAYLLTDQPYAVQLIEDKGRSNHVPEELLPLYVEYEQIPAKGQAAERWLKAHPDYYNFVYSGPDSILHQPPIEFRKVVSEKFETTFDDIYAGKTEHEKDLFRFETPWFEQEGLSTGKFKTPVAVKSVAALRLSIANQAKDDVYNRILEPVKKTQYLKGNPQYAVNRIQIEGLNKGVPENYIGNYVDWKYKKLSGYALDRYMIAHLDFYNKVYKDILGEDRLDFRNVPSEALESQYRIYSDLRSKEKARYLSTHGQLRAWLKKRALLRPSKAVDTLTPALAR